MDLSLKAIVSKNVRAIRKSQNMSQQDLANKTKLSVRYISRVENDPPDVTLYNLERLAKGLNVTPTDLIADRSDGSIKLSKKERDAVAVTVRLLQTYLESNDP